jgi:linoleoyl-CoA desaturase
MNMNVPIFSKKDDTKFFRTLNKRVNEYFKDNNLKKTGNWKLYLKTIILFTLFIAPYFIIVASPKIHFGLFILLSVILGIGMAGIGMNVMHDGNHGAYSTNSWEEVFTS